MIDKNALVRALLGQPWPEHNALASPNPFAAPVAAPSFGSFAPGPYRSSLLNEGVTNALFQPVARSIWDVLVKEPVPPASSPNKLAPLFAPEVKRKVYFAFSFDDIIRVNNVRQAGKIGPREARNPRQFTDRSIWEKRDIKNEENLKNLMRRAMQHSSVVCILIGTETWHSRWVKYEIARSVVDCKGLLALHLNNIDHHARKAPDRLGINPLHMIGIYRDRPGSFYLCERHPAVVNAATGELDWEWRYYEDFTDAVSKPAYMPEMSVGSVLPLSVGAIEYDMVGNDGYKRIGAWLDAAAEAVGR